MGSFPEGTNSREMTFGEKRVRAAFNPSDNEEVTRFKGNAALAIDMLEMIKMNTEDGETKRLAALAQTAFEEACMWAVKAVTS